MKSVIVSILILVSCTRCQKNIAKNPDYQRFVGEWTSFDNEMEITRISVSKNLKIIVESSVERRSVTKPEEVDYRKSGYETNGVFWDEAFFYKKTISGNYKGVQLTINTTDDTIFYSKKPIVDFYADSITFIKLIRL